ncbi:TetR/AcrR family transcriptional regulator [Candidatus Contubernalis alkaliaceticus]|uniref:TetR/AcrR family transcriptional regulator n=1 Tax=Candidatus Contubernalis alkaliaceticus TaxID=338645 RepID=UPI001F4BF073|nr:TetR/AcrR family transcriptional regulator [Candidatus Contubernalis alkalaceticus]UNC91330.1 TetR/AcrR family transcriptional regulator [Candidatus Contubernalis alkalaceticus]
MNSSTKDIIKEKALSLFAQRGYDGTTMKDIAELVGIKTPSLYAHFTSKEELFFSVYEDLANEYVYLMEKIMGTAENMDMEDKLFFIFQQYMIYYMKNPEIQAFWNQITLFTPPVIKEKFFAHVANCDGRIQKKMEKIFEEGIEKGFFRKDCPIRMSLSFRFFREGIINWMMVMPELKKEKYIKNFWRDLWLGLKKQ